MKKLCLTVSFVILSVILLVSCAAKLPDGMTEEKVKEAGENVVNLLNNKSYDELIQLCDKTMSDALTASPLSDVWEPFYSDVGTYDSIKKIAISGQKDFAVYVAQIKYSNKTAVLTISFNKDYLLSGLYFK